MGIDLLLATGSVLPAPDPDAAPLAEALDRAGIRARLAAWDDEAEDWRAPMTLIRSTWNYLWHADAFADWTRRFGAGALHNPGPLVRWNMHKGYLLELQAKGIDTVPTIVVPRGATVDARSVGRARGWSRIVVKPAISAGSFDTHVFHIDGFDDSIYGRLNRTQDVLLQPFIESIEHSGERSLIVVDGTLTHAIRKSPRFAEDIDSPEVFEGPMPITPPERRLAEAVIGTMAEPPLYARVDLMHRPDGEPMLAELELIEPSLFFDRGPRALEALVRGIERRLGRFGA